MKSKESRPPSRAKNDRYSTLRDARVKLGELHFRSLPKLATMRLGEEKTIDLWEEFGNRSNINYDCPKR